MYTAVPLIFLAFLLLVAGYYFARMVIYPRVFPFEETRLKCIEWGHFVAEEYDAWPNENVSIRSPYGYDLSATYHPVEGSRRTLVISHGITFSRYGSVKYARLFTKRGFNVLIYDLRHHGCSGGKNTSFGYYEKQDLKAVVDWAFDRLGPGGLVGTFGESLGAAITLQHAAMDPRIAFAIADCPYSALPDLLAFRLKTDFHLPRFPLIPLANLFTRLLGGWWFREASPIRYIDQIKTPIFFIHGQNDTYIPPGMSEAMFAAKQRGFRKLYLAPNADHAMALVNNPLEYDQQIGDFLAEIGLPASQPETVSVSSHS